MIHYVSNNASSPATAWAGSVKIFRKKNVTKEIVNATAKDTKNRPATNFNISVVHFEESHNLSPSQKVFISKWFSKFLDIHQDLEQS